MRYLLVSLVALCSPAFTLAQGFVESVSPPVIERGKTTRVTFSGHDLAPGQSVWCSLPSGAVSSRVVESRPDRLVFDISAANDCPVGICGLRLATRDGLTNAVLFHIDDLPSKGQIAGDRPAALSLPACFWGTFREGTLDRYTLRAAQGERISFEAVANRLGKDADPLITIRDSSGRFVAERDNDPGLYFDFRFEHTFEKAGEYTIEIRDARYRASEHHHYILRVGKFPPERVAVPVQTSNEPSGIAFENRKRSGDQGSSWLPVLRSNLPVTVAREWDAARDSALTQSTSGPVQLGFLLSPTRINPFQSLDRLLGTGRLQPTPGTVPGVLSGVLRSPGQRQAFSFQLDKNQRIFVRGEAKALDSPLDLEFSLIDRTGRELRRSTESRDGSEATLDFTAGTAGEYGLVARDVLRDGGDSHLYQLTVRGDPFPPVLTAEVEGLTVPRGSYQPVPILVARTGSTGPIKLELVGAPSGVRLVPDEIPESLNTVVCRLEASDSAPLGTHTFQIAVISGNDRTFVKTRPLIDKKTVNIDLIPIALREDQTRLPPALTDRFALQISEPSPFTFELPERVVTLSRYQRSPVPVATTRVPGFDGPIRFHAVGGQLADKGEGRTRVYADFPEATARDAKISGVVVSRILSNVAKARIDVSATGTHQGRKVTLIRTFELDLVTAFRFPPEQVKLAFLPGESGTVKLSMQRSSSFDGPVTLHLSPLQGIEFPETVLLPKGQSTVEFPVKIASDLQPRRQGINVQATADVDGFEEEIRGQPVEIEVKKIEVKKIEIPKKK
jgi:hypothetical protein